MPRAIAVALCCSLAASAGLAAEQATDDPEAAAPAAAVKPGPLPFLAEEAAKAGVVLPRPIGLTLVGQLQGEDILSHELNVGLGGATKLNADFVEFGNIRARVQNLILRGDVWVLPFLDVYALAGGTWSQTRTELIRPISLVIDTDAHGVTLGFGATIAWGIEPYGFLSLDGNLEWTDLDILSQPQRTGTLTPRAGHRFVSQTVPERVLTLWVGSNLEFFFGRVLGSTVLGSAGAGGGPPLPPDFGDWLSRLSPAQQQAVGDLLSQLIKATQGPNAANARADFDLVVKTRRTANLLVGGELQLDRRWQFRAEGGLLGARSSVNANVTYRFDL